MEHSKTNKNNMFLLILLCILMLCTAAAGCTIKLVGLDGDTQQTAVQESSGTDVSQTTTTTAKPVPKAQDICGVWDGAFLLAFDKSGSVMWSAQTVKTYRDNGDGTITVNGTVGTDSERYAFETEGDSLTLTDSEGGQCVFRRVKNIQSAEDSKTAEGTWAYMAGDENGHRVWSVLTLESASDGTLKYIGKAEYKGNFAPGSRDSVYSLKLLGGVFRIRMETCAVLTYDKNEKCMKMLSSSNNTTINSDFKLYRLSSNPSLNSVQINEQLRELESKISS